MGLLKELEGKRVYLDTNIFIYAVEAASPWAFKAAEILTAIDQGQFFAVTSTLSLAEALVKPFQLGHEEAISAYQALIQDRISLKVVSIDRKILVEAARLRGAALRSVALPRPKLPDAIHAVTAMVEGCQVILTNDLRFQAFPEIEKLYLKDFLVTGGSSGDLP